MAEVAGGFGITGSGGRKKRVTSAGIAGMLAMVGGIGGMAGSGVALADPVMPSISNVGTVYNVTSYGASTGSADNAPAIQAAINAANGAGGGTVLVPAGTYLSGPLTLKSNINFEIAGGGKLQALAYGKYPSSGSSSVSNFLTAKNISNFEITGSGTIDGQGSGWWSAYSADSSIGRPRLLNITGSNTLYLSGVTFQNSPQFNVAFGGTNEVTIDGVTVSNPSNAPNTDGIDPAGNNYLIRNCTISTGDDNIAVKPWSTACSNITITSCTFGTGHGVSVGGQTNDGLNNMTVSNCTFNGTTNGIRLKAGRGYGGLVQNLSYSDITMTNVQHPIDITSYYLNGGTSSQPSDPSTDPGQPVTSTTPFWKDIVLNNIQADLSGTRASEAGIVYGLPEAHVQGITFNNVDVTASKGLELYNVDDVYISPDSTFTVSSGSPELTYDATFGAPVPEPGTLGMMAMAGMMVLRRRRRG